uniref:Hemolin n=1 Tax=Heliothis virescens TaxID=7102 RepID=A0A2A4K4W1_HELVI
MHRRQAIEDVYDDQLMGDEGTDDETMNDTDNEPAPQKIPAVIETTAKQYEVKAGENVTLECKVTPDKDTVAAWFAKDSQYFISSVALHPEETRYSIVEHTKDLRITNAKLSDSGVFRCEILQKEPVGVNHTLLVLQAPVIENMSASNGGSVAVGGDLLLTCLVVASPVPTVLWSVTRKDRPNERLTEKDADFHVEGNLYSMHIRNVKKEDSGEYYCYALNTLGSHQAETSVVVNGKPQVHVAKTIVNSAIQIKAVLQCAAHEEISCSYSDDDDGPNQDGDWTTLNVPLPSGSHHKYEVSFTLEDKQLQPGKYMAMVKVKNSKSWGGTNEPVFVTVDPQSLYIQTASVYRQNSAHSIRPVYTALSTILMYLLVRML